MKKFVGFLIIPALLGALAIVALVFNLGIPSPAHITSAPLSAESFIVTGAILGDGDCVINYTIDEQMNDEVTGIDCPPEGMPADAASKDTLREQAKSLYPNYEKRMSEITNP